MKYILTSFFALCFLGAWSQARYNPAIAGTTSNKPYAPSQFSGTDARTLFYDSANFRWRPYVNKAEVLSYLYLPKFRGGQIDLVVNTGGVLANGVVSGGRNDIYYFKNCYDDSCLVLKQDTSEGGSPNTSIGNGVKIAVDGTNNIKTVFPGANVTIDSVTNTNGLTISASGGISKIDTNSLRLTDTLYTKVPVFKSLNGLRSITLNGLDTGFVYITSINGELSNFLYKPNDNTTTEDSVINIRLNNGKLLQRVINGRINLKWYGAKGDSTDAQYYIQKALNYSASIKVPLYIPAGIYLMSNFSTDGSGNKYAIDVPDNASIIGDEFNRPIIKFTNNTSAYSVFHILNKRNIYISNIEGKSDSSYFSKYFQITGSRNITFYKVKVPIGPSSSITGGGSDSVFITGCELTNNGTNAENAVDNISGSYWQVKYCDIYSNINLSNLQTGRGKGIAFTYDPTNFLGIIPHTNFAIDNYIHNTGGGVQHRGDSNGVSRGNFIYNHKGNMITVSYPIGLGTTQASKNIIIEGNVVKGLYPGIYNAIVLREYVDNVSIVGNTVDSIGGDQSGGVGEGHGIYNLGATNVSIVGNTVKRTYWIGIENTGAYCTITGNTVADTRGRGIDNSGKNTTISGNTASRTGLYANPDYGIINKTDSVVVAANVGNMGSNGLFYTTTTDKVAVYQEYAQTYSNAFSDMGYRTSFNSNDGFNNGSAILVDGTTNAFAGTFRNGDVLFRDASAPIVFNTFSNAYMQFWHGNSDQKWDIGNYNSTFTLFDRTNTKSPILVDPNQPYAFIIGNGEGYFKRNDTTVAALNNERNFDVKRNLFIRETSTGSNTDSVLVIINGQVKKVLQSSIGGSATTLYNGNSTLTSDRTVSFGAFSLNFNGNTGFGTTPSARIHALSTTEQLRLGYDASNYSSFLTSSGGNLTVTPSGGTTSIIGGLAWGNGNFNTGSPSASGISSTTVSQVLAASATGTNYRVVERGSTTGTLTANYNYFSHIIGEQAATEAATGTHPLIGSFLIKAVNITGGSATATDGATFYIEGAGNATVTGFNDAFRIGSGNARFGGNINVVGDINSYQSGAIVMSTGYSYATGGITAVGRNTTTGKYEQIPNSVTQTSSTSAANLAFGGDYIYTGIGIVTWSLPAPGSQTVGRNFMVTIKNRGTAIITVNVTGGGSSIYTTSTVSSIGINPGEAVMLMPDNIIWNVE